MFTLSAYSNGMMRAVPSVTAYKVAAIFFAVFLSGLLTLFARYSEARPEIDWAALCAVACFALTAGFVFLFAI